MLDDVESIIKIDKQGMLDDVASFPDQIVNSKDIVEKTNLESIFKVDNIVISGMGASSISGDIIQAIFRDRLDIPIFVTRQYDLPKWTNKNTLVISQSYSGNTEETLSTFKHAWQKRSKIIAISSGGKLEEYCNHRKVPLIKIPSGIQPRAATGYMLFSALYALMKAGIIHKDIEHEIDESIGLVKQFKKENSKEIPTSNNKSKQIAKKLHNFIPQIYGFDIYTPIAKRWCTQLNENSKLICRYDEVSECNHNDIVGWSMNPEVSKKFACILFRDHDLESIYMRTRLNFMNKLFKDVAGNVLEINVQGKKKLARMMYLMYLGDFLSCYLAVLRKIDPTPVEAIMELKSELAKL